MEIILRAEAVEQAQAGDKCDFTGTLIVVPDVAQLSTPGIYTTVPPETMEPFAAILPRSNCGFDLQFHLGENRV